jgi:hypothetical protein
MFDRIHDPQNMVQFMGVNKIAQATSAYLEDYFWEIFLKYFYKSLNKYFFNFLKYYYVKHYV